MIIKKIEKNGIFIFCMVSVVIIVFTQNISWWFSYLLGSLASFLNFFINRSFLDLSNEKAAIAKALSSYILRIGIYTIVMVGGFYFADLAGLLLAFFGSLTIRVAILIFGIMKGE